MNWKPFYKMQSQLSEKIERDVTFSNEELKPLDILGLLVEIGEVANEKKSFKYWTKEKESEREVIIEEYVDVLHFLLLIGNRYEYEYHPPTDYHFNEKDWNINDVLLNLFFSVFVFYQNPNRFSHEMMWYFFIYLGKLLGFSEQEVKDAYKRKNEKNHQRIEDGY